MRYLEIKEALPSEQYISDIKEVYRAIARIKQKKCYTNFFISAKELQQWANEKSLSIIQSQSSVMIFRKRSGFSVIYFFTSDTTDICMLMKTLLDNQSRRYVIGIVYKKEYPYDIVQGFCSNGFKKETVYERMILSDICFTKYAQESCLKKAVVEDIDEIYDIFYSNFNEYTDQLPTKKEILKAINSGKHDIIIAKHERKKCIVNVFWFENKGKTIHWRYWVIRPEFRGKGLGRKLLQQVLGKYAHASRIILWVRDNNPQAKAFYEELGFVSDGLYDCILCKL